MLKAALTVECEQGGFKEGLAAFGKSGCSGFSDVFWLVVNFAS